MPIFELTDKLCSDSKKQSSSTERFQRSQKNFLLLDKIDLDNEEYKTVWASPETAYIWSCNEKTIDIIIGCRITKHNEWLNVPFNTFKIKCKKI